MKKYKSMWDCIDMSDTRKVRIIQEYTDDNGKTRARILAEFNDLAEAHKAFDQYHDTSVSLGYNSTI